MIGDGARDGARLDAIAGWIQDSPTPISSTPASKAAAPGSCGGPDHHPAGWLEATIAPAALSVVVRAA